MPLLDVQDLVKRFPGAGGKTVQALNGVSFVIERGETLSLVGESGSGKTTVGRCVIGLLQPEDGGVLFDGQALGARRNVRSRSVRGRIQFVFQEPAESLDPRMQAGDILAEPLIYLGVSAAEREHKVAEIAARVGLSSRQLELYPAELSAGLQQRIGIGRAMATDPELIVLDEPTSALDPTARAEIIDLLIRLQRETETAYLFISHDLSTVRLISRRVAVMYLGAIVEIGEAEDIFERPLHPYTVGLLASALLPHPSLKPSRAVSLEGEIPSPIDLPPGCALASRCPFVEDACRAAMPPLIASTPHRMVRCINTHKVEALGKVGADFARFQALAQEALSVGAGPEGEP